MHLLYLIHSPKHKSIFPYYYIEPIPIIIDLQLICLIYSYNLCRLHFLSITLLDLIYLLLRKLLKVYTHSYPHDLNWHISLENINYITINSLNYAKNSCHTLSVTLINRSPRSNQFSYLINPSNISYS